MHGGFDVQLGKLIHCEEGACRTDLRTRAVGAPTSIRTLYARGDLETESAEGRPMEGAGKGSHNLPTEEGRGSDRASLVLVQDASANLILILVRGGSATLTLESDG